MGWKQVIAEVVSHLNQSYIEQSGELPEHLFDNGNDFMTRESGRIGRFMDDLKERKVVPLKSESAIRFKNIDEKEDWAAADVLVRQHLFYEQSKLLLHQEYVNIYRVECRKLDNNDWVVASWVPMESPTGFNELEALQVRGSHKNQPSLHSIDLFGSQRGYDRAKAVRYAETWWNGHNPKYALFADDCTNFISQCLHEGGLPMEFTSRRDKGWWYRGPNEAWSYSWSVANGLYWYLRRGNNIQTQIMSSPQQLTLGDIICYDFDGDGRWQHNTIVVGFDRSGMPLVNAHTNNSRMRYWDYRDSYAWTEQTQYTFFHIIS